MLALTYCKAKGEQIPLMQDENESAKINALRRVYQVQYQFAPADQKCQLFLVVSVVVKTRSQHILFLELKSSIGNLLDLNLCYVTENRRMGKLPLLVGRTLGQLQPKQNAMPVLVINPTTNDVELKKERDVTEDVTRWSWKRNELSIPYV